VHRRPGLSGGIYKGCVPVENGFLLNDGAEKKKRERALFMLVKQHPDVVLFVVGVSDLDGGRDREGGREGRKERERERERKRERDLKGGHDVSRV